MQDVTPVDTREYQNFLKKCMHDRGSPYIYIKLNFLLLII